MQLDENALYHASQEVEAYLQGGSVHAPTVVEIAVTAYSRFAAMWDVERVAHALQKAITTHPVVLELDYGASAEIYKQLAEAAIAALTPGNDSDAA